MSQETQKVQKTDEEWREQLSPEEYEITRNAGTGAIAVIALINATGLLDSVSPLPALLIAGSLAIAAAIGVLLSLKREARDEALALLRSRRMAMGWQADPIPPESGGET